MKLRKMKRKFFQQNICIVRYQGELIHWVPEFVAKKVSFKRFIEVLRTI